MFALDQWVQNLTLAVANSRTLVIYINFIPQFPHLTNGKSDSIYSICILKIKQINTKSIAQHIINMVLVFDEGVTWLEFLPPVGC